MKKLLVLVTTACLMGLFAPVAMAEEMKIGVIDLQKIMQTSPQVTAINSQLEKEFKPRQEKLVAAQKDLQEKMDKLKRDGAVMKDADRTKLQSTLATDRANFQSMAESFQQDVTGAQNKAMQKIMQQVASAVSEIANSNKYDLVLQKSSVPFANPKLDITDDVIKALAKQKS